MTSSGRLARPGRSTDLDRAAQAYAEAVAGRTATIQEEYRFLAAANYLPWRAASHYVTVQSIEDEAGLADRLVAEASGCRPIMSAEYSEVGVGAAQDDGGYWRLLFVVAERFEPGRAEEYGRQVLAEINQIRQRGVTCFGTTYAPQPPYQWSEVLAAAAQGHSDDMATWPFQGANVHAGRDGSQPAERVRRATVEGCQVTYMGENVAVNSPSVESGPRAWTGQPPMTADHCRTVMGDATHAGVGVALAAPLAATTYGRNPWVTLDVGRQSGTCRADTVMPPPASEPPVTTSTTYGTFDPDQYYRITNVALGGYSLDIQPHDHAAHTPTRGEAVVLNPSGDYSGQHWVLRTLPYDNPGSQDRLFGNYVTMSTRFRGDDIVVSTAQVAPVLLLRQKYDSSSRLDWPRKSQYWLFTAVPGRADTFHVSNGWYKNVFLAASPGNRLTMVSNPDRSDPATQWRVEQVQ